MLQKEMTSASAADRQQQLRRECRLPKKTLTMVKIRVRG